MLFRTFASNWAKGSITNNNIFFITPKYSFIMKKIFTLTVLAVLTAGAFSASATTYYLCGAINGWGLAVSDYAFTEQSDGTYILQLDVLYGELKSMTEHGVI